MGRKTQQPAGCTSSDEAPNFLPESQQNVTKNRKARAMAVLGEYMRYFGGVNGLYRNIVRMQAEVVSKHGRNGWKNLSQEDQDQAFNTHIIKNSVTDCTSETSHDSNENSKETGLSEQESRNHRRDSLQSIITDHDCFSGPFSWKTKSLQDLAFPSTPDHGKNRKQREGKPRNKVLSKLQMETAEGSGTSESEDEVIPSMTLEQLRRELRKNYEEQQAARLKMRQLDAEKNFGVQKKPEGITKAAVAQRTSPTRKGRHMSDNYAGLPVLPADLKPASALKPVSREKVTSLTEISPTKSDVSQQQPRSPPGAISRTKPRNNSVPYQRIVSNGDSSPKQSSRRKSADFDEILEAAEASHRRRAENSAQTSGVLSRHDEGEVLRESLTRIGSVSSNGNSPEKRMTVKELSGDWNQYFSQKSAVQSTSGNENSDIMDLFKNW